MAQFHHAAAALLLAGRLHATAGADFLLFDLSARSLSQSGALAAGSQGLAQLRQNPAGLGTLARQEFHFTHVEAFGDWSHDWLAWGRPFGFGHLAMELQWSRLKPFPYYDALGQEAGTLEAGSQMLGLAYAKGLAGNTLHAGANVRFFRSQLSDYANSGASADFGLHFRTAQGLLNGALVVQNAGYQGAFYQEVEALPLLFRASLALEGAPAESLALRVCLDSLNYADLYRPNEMRAGAQATLFQRLALRGGWRTQGRQSRFSAGMGLDMGFAELSYAYAPDPLLGAWHAVTLEWASLPWLD